MKPPVQSEKPLRKPCDAWARSADEKAILFANHLYDVFKPNPPKGEFSPPVFIQEIMDHSDPVEVDLDQFKQIVKHKIKPKKSQRYHPITPEIIKKSAWYSFWDSR